MSSEQESSAAFKEASRVLDGAEQFLQGEGKNLPPLAKAAYLLAARDVAYSKFESAPSRKSETEVQSANAVLDGAEQFLQGEGKNFRARSSNF